MSGFTLTATVDRGEAVLRFPYDERMRQLLRALPGRRWDPLDRSWRVPLESEQARALERLLAGLPVAPQVSDELARALARRRRGAPRGLLRVDLARPDEDWWLTFALDGPPAAVAALLEVPGARRLAEIGRALIPADDASAAVIERLRGAGLAVECSPAAARALGERRGEDGGAAAASPYAAELRRDRRGEHWVVIAGAHGAAARAHAERLQVRVRLGADGSVGLAAREEDAEDIRALLDRLAPVSVQPRVLAWLERASAWRGTVDVQGPADDPMLLLLGDPRRLPAALRDRARPAPGGAEVPLDGSSAAAAGGLGGWLTPAARRCLEALAEGRPAPRATLQLSRLHDPPAFVLAPGHDPALPPAFAALEGVLAPLGGRGSEHAALHAIRADPFCVPELDGFLAAGGVWVDPDALAILQEIRQQHAMAQGIVTLSAATGGELEVPGLGGELKPFQRAGVAYALARRRVLLADEQGLGKTIEAIASIAAAEAYPALVVCPAGLKLTWLAELRRWLPQRSVRILSGLGPAGETGPADVTVVNYDVLGPRAEELAAIAPRALVLDESHYCKNPGAKRTQAAQRIAAAVAPGGLVLALSGTPVTNRPAELVAQLRILGRLEEFGSGARFGARFQGPDAHLRLHWHLRARCMVRRLKADVLPQLPAKRRAVVPVELDNESEYRLAERDVVAWLQSQPLDLRELDAKVAAALRAERLVRLNALKQLAARGKLRSALAWIHDFCSSGERLVVFARHRAVQQALLERFPGALHILGEDSPAARQLALERFQEPDGPHNQLIVCSLEVAGHGLTLTRASNVAFLELDWTPAKHDQAEDRCHRIGQASSVTAYYLLAAETVDETIATLLERKRAVIAAVTDGREEDEENVLGALVRELRGRPYRHLRAAA